MSVRQLTSRPGTVILLGRAVAQAGFFAFSVAPSLVLGNADFNDLIITVTVFLLVVVAPATAFQLHMLRTTGATHAKADALKKSLLLSVPCAVIGVLIAGALSGFGTSTLALALGSIANVVSMLAASYLALDGQFRRSALLDSSSGVFFLVVSVVLVARDGSLTAWSVGYLVVWCLTGLIALVGPLRVRLGDRSGSLGPAIGIVRSGSALLGIGVMSMAFNRADYLTMTIVASASEASRYALAGRFVGPILIALGSLNNSLYVQQIRLKDQPEQLQRITASASRRVGALAVVVAPLVAVGVIAIGRISSSLADRHLLVPTVLLACAAIPFAFAVPYAYALTAIGRERIWLRILVVATVANLLVVLVVGRWGATPTALAWLATQLGVWAAVKRTGGRIDSLRRKTFVAAR